MDTLVANADGKTIYYNYINDGTELAVTFRGRNYDEYENEYTGNIVIPEEVTYMSRARKVTRIGEYTFYQCSSLSSITIPNSVTSIGDYAFEYCSVLTSATIGNSVTSIGDYAFFRCSSLTSVTLNSNAIASKSYYSNSGLKNIFGSQVTKYILGEGVTSIGNDAFSGCADLTSVTIGNSVTSIGSSAFSGCSGLTSVTIGNSVTSIGDGAFSGCSVLTSVTLNSNAIASKSYSSNDGLKNIFGDQVTKYILGYWCPIKN